MSSKLYNNTKEIIDNKTGEVTTTINSFLQKAKTKDEFVKLFVENIYFLNENLSNSALRVILAIIKNLNYQNAFNYTSDFINYFESKKILGKSSVYRALKELEEKQIIYKILDEEKENLEIVGSNVYIVNPNIIGKGSFHDLTKLRQTIVRTFDFNKLEFTQEYNIETEYEGLEDFKNNPEKYTIDSIRQTKKVRRIENEIVVVKKDNSNDDNIINAEELNETYQNNNQISMVETVPNETNKEEKSKSMSDKELEYAIIIAQNEAKKLDIELLKLKNGN